jgi:hypothetical protein
MRTNLRRIAVSSLAGIVAIMSSATISRSQNWQNGGIYSSMDACKAQGNALIRSGSLSSYTCTPLPGLVRPLDTGTAKEIRHRSVKDGMSPDHIPSFAAIKKVLETNLGRKLTNYESRNLRDATNAIVYSTRLHQQYSRTYGGRNNPAQILQDSTDLQRAFIKDTQRIRPYLIESGHTPQQVDAAFKELDALNKALGLY